MTMPAMKEEYPRNLRARLGTTGFGELFRSAAAGRP
jgi:hypothetical protein